MKVADLTWEAVRARVAYDPETGIFVRKVAAGGRKIGDLAGCPHAEGYVQIELLGVKCLAHRLAFFWMGGVWPSADVDHRNGIRSDNRWANLRLVSRSENMQNMRSAMKDSRTGVLGVTVGASGKFIAQIARTDGNRSRYIGSFSTLEEASRAYLSEKARQHPFQTLVPSLNSTGSA